MSRKLVTIRTVSEVNPIEGADAIECLTVEGWKVVSQKGNFKAGDPCVYFEIDSFLPDGNPLWQDLVDKSSREFEGKKGHVLRTIKLRGQVSQGFCIPLHEFPEIINTLGLKITWTNEAEVDLKREHGLDIKEELKSVVKDMLRTESMREQLAALREQDFAELLGVLKYEAPIPAELAGQVKGTFPSFIKKTDQERCQNLGGQIFADLDAKYEVSVKLDGTSMTVYHDPEQIGGVCSRNLELNTVAIENDNNTMVKIARESGLLQVLEDHPTFAVQGELMGPGIQGNREQLKKPQLFIFDMFNIQTGEYLSPEIRAEFLRNVAGDQQRMMNPEFVSHVPILHKSISLRELGFKEIPAPHPSFTPSYDENGNVVGGALGGEDSTPQRVMDENMEKLLAFAEGKSLKHDVREGVVFKRLDGQFSFKVISNKFLLKSKD